MIANILFDAILVGILLWGLILGWRNGFIQMLFKRLRVLAAIVISCLLSSRIAILFQGRITKPVEDLFFKYIGDASGIQSGSDISNKLPTLLKSLAQLFGIDLSSHANEAVGGGGDAVQAFVGAVSAPIAHMLSFLIAFFLIFFVSLLVIRLLGLLVNAVFHLPVLKQINKVAGSLVGLAFFSLIAWGACELGLFGISLCSDVAFFSGFSVEGTFVAKFFHEIFKPLSWLLSF